MANLTIAKKNDTRQVEKALRESQARLAGIIASAMDAIVTIDQDQRILIFNKAAEQMFGYSMVQVKNRPLEILIPERFRRVHREHIQQFGETGVTNRTMGKLGKLFGKRSNGEEFPIEASISQIDSADGKIFTVILRDITERVHAEERLVENEQQLGAIFEQAAVGIATVAPDGRIIRVNQRFCQIVGYDCEDLPAKNIRDITHPEDIAREVDLQNQLFSGKIPTFTLEKRYVRKDGSLIWANLSASLVSDLNGTPKYLIKVIEDITDRKKAEAAVQAKNDEVKTMSQQLWQTAKLATMGELAASIAHELNNPLAILSLRIESLLATIQENDSAWHELQVMEQEVDRMASLVGNLLQFTRSTQRQVSSLNLEEEIDRTLELIHTHMVHRHIEVEKVLAPDLPMIQADRQQLRQLFLNLFTNSSDAMPTGGTLTIRAQPLPGKKIQIEIEDTGTGIGKVELRQVMEPFYTTKGEGKGTGLGLAICKRIVEEHHGSIQISSPGIGKGATVQIVLPGNNISKPTFLEE